MNKPPRVAAMDFWGSPPPERSARCAWWIAAIVNGWRPNKRIRALGYYCAAEWFGVYIWEYLNEIYPCLEAHR